ncbi:MAG: hypothetical protein NTW19_22590 [Planctomycetota bacterium]|nr:hypothetical protein [Planctomycetota bacterium]
MRRAALGWAMAGVIVVAATSGVASACGPFFPNQVLLEGDDTLLAAPEGDLSLEVSKIKPAAMTAARAVPPESGNAYQQSSEVDLADLKESLKGAKVEAAKAEALLREYARVREAIVKASPRRTEFYMTPEQEAANKTVPLKEQPVAVPAGLPREFDLYIRGLVAFRRGEVEPARAQWKALLDLPPEQRQARSVWAAYMLGRSCENVGGVDAAEEIRWYAQARELARTGFSDHLGLAVASVGWEAKAALAQGKADRAVELYLMQADAGDPTALPSLRTATKQLFASDPATLRRAAERPAVARALNAALVSRPDRGAISEDGDTKPPQAKAWLEAIEAVGARDVAGADLCAWAAYECGDAAAAQRWADRAPAQSAIAQWIRAKLLLRAGKTEAALEALGKAAKLFPTKENWPALEDEAGSVSSPAGIVRGEAAMLRMARREYTAALDLLLRGDYWLDAAYVAERVLTPDELKQYVDKAWPTAPEPPPTEPRGWARQTRELEARAATNIRGLLARRLTRVGRWREAGPYFPAAMRPALEAYVKAIRSGRDEKRSAAARANDLWEAAKWARHAGMDLMGTELDPDWSVYGGAYDLGDSARARADRKAATKLAGMTPDESERAKAQRAAPALRFHYRYIAAGHAWAAIALMPDDSEETARRLCVAGGWLKALDPKAADRFYKALTTRCGSTALGRDAVRLKWFPKVKDEYPPGYAPKPEEN